MTKTQASLHRDDYEWVVAFVVPILISNHPTSLDFTADVGRHYITSDMNSHMAICFRVPEVKASLTLCVRGGSVRSLLSVVSRYLTPENACKLASALRMLEHARRLSTLHLKERLRLRREEKVKGASR